MSLIRPYVDRAIGRPLTRCSNVWERFRFEWRLADGGDPATGLATFLAGHGLTLPGREPDPAPHRAHPVCGATLFVSAGAGAQLVGAPRGASGPVPVVPDVVAVVYAHGDGRGLGGDRG